MRAYDGGDGAMMRPLLVFLLAKDVFSYISYYKSHVYGFKGCCQCDATWQSGRRQRKKTHHDKIPLSSSPIACPLPTHCLPIAYPLSGPRGGNPAPWPETQGSLWHPYLYSIFARFSWLPEYGAPSERQAGGSPENLRGAPCLPSPFYSVFGRNTEKPVPSQERCLPLNLNHKSCKGQ